MKGRIKHRFRSLRAEGKKAFIPYVMAGDPDIKTTESVIPILEECGADIIELGVPFSDPLADGPTIQRAAERALANGVTLSEVIKMVKRVREKVSIPVVLMTYYNPVFKYGNRNFVKDAVDAGVDGVIIPDLPPDEAGELIQESKQRGLDTIFLLAPTSTEKRIRYASRASSGFIYYVSMTGITGSKLTVDDSIKRSVERIRLVSKKPVCVGFGVSTPEEAGVLSSIADGVIVGSAIVKRIHSDPHSLKRFLGDLKRAI